MACNLLLWLFLEEFIRTLENFSDGAKIRRQMDCVEMINMITEQLKGIYANSPRKSYENLDFSLFEWEVKTNFINK